MKNYSINIKKTKTINKGTCVIKKNIFLITPILLPPLIGAQTFEKPTIEQLRNTDTVEISYKCHRDIDKPVNMENWLNIATTVDTLIDHCYTYPNEKDDELFEEVFDTVRFIRANRSNPGVYTNLMVAGLTKKEHTSILLNDHEYKLTNNLDDTQIDQLLNLCHQTWWAKDRTHQELETILENSFYLALIDTTTQKVIGFIRAVTDYVRYAGIFDVMVDTEYQGKGLGKLLIDDILHHPKLEKLTLVELHCLDDKVALYEKFGFEKSFDNLVPMRLNRKK